jgi:hypothetical protein
LHKPIGILAEGDTKFLVGNNCTEFLEDESEKGQWIDWFQGVKESGRWDVKEYPNDPILIIDQGEERWDNMIPNDLVRKFIEFSQEDFKQWHKLGTENLKNKKMEDLGNTAMYFSLSGSKSGCWLFDNTGYSGGEGIRDKQFFEKAKNWMLEQTDKKYWLCLYDIHY